MLTGSIQALPDLSKFLSTLRVFAMIFAMIFLFRDWRYVLAQSVLPSSLGRRTDQTILDFARFYWRLSASRKATAAQSSAQGHLLVREANEQILKVNYCQDISMT